MTINAVLRTTVHPAFQFVLVIAFLVLALNFRFVLPRYDYWDVIYESTFLLEDGDLQLSALLSFLVNPFADQFMATTKLTIYLTNHLAKQHVIVAEIVIAWMLLVVGYVLLLSVLRIPLPGGQPKDNKEAIKMLVVFLLYWWPATLPSLTNNWFAIQYGLVITTGLGSIYCLVRQNQNIQYQLVGCGLFLLGALSHGTGLLLGPVLLIWAYSRRNTPMWVILFLALTSLTLLVLIWMQHQSVVIPNSQTGFSFASIKFLLRIITPPFWEQVIFIVIVVPMLALALSRLFLDRVEHSSHGAVVILFWGLIVWISTFVTRYELLEHANPHYLRFYVLFYAALFVIAFDSKSLKNRYIASLVGFLFLLVWAKGLESGISMATLYRMQNIQGHYSLVEDISAENPKTNYIYPIKNHRLTTVLIPRLTEYEGFGYREMLTTR